MRACQFDDVINLHTSPCNLLVNIEERAFTLNAIQSGGYGGQTIWVMQAFKHHHTFQEKRKAIHLATAMMAVAQKNQVRL